MAIGRRSQRNSRAAGVGREDFLGLGAAGGRARDSDTIAGGGGFDVRAFLGARTVSATGRACCARLAVAAED